ncbi:MAG: glycosyltransferase family 2 protein [Akkermansia sp.]|nr:glycosyltransferase family 2 protein [Akkermansia sp.]
MNKPSFSVITPCYNVENYVTQALKSILNQDYDGDIEYIIVDDGSTDNTWNEICKLIAKENNKKNIITIRHNQNKGVAAATDTACQHSTKDWIVKADADDIQMPDRLSTYAQIIQKYPQICAVELACQRIKENGEPYEFIPFASQSYNISEYIQESALQRYQGRLGINNEPCFLDFGGTVAFKRNLFLKWGNLVNTENTQRFSDDTVWGTRYSLSGPIAGANILACLYRSRSTGNLEYRSKGNSYSNMIQNELNSSNSMKVKAESFKTAKLCCYRALNDATLSDWNHEHIRQFAQKNQQYELYFSVRSNWWNWSWFKRINWYIHNKNKLIPQHQKWCFLRLLPLCIVAIIKSIKSKYSK